MEVISKAFEAGGWAMYIILFWLVLAVAFIIERAIYLYGSSINKDVFLSTMQKCILGNDVRRAIQICSQADAPLARIVKSGLMKVNRPDAEVQAAMDETALQELPKIEKRTAFLGLFANLAMLSGLFGTVLGLIGAFEAVSGADQATKAALLAAGISHAMWCTAFGLLAAIIALMGMAVLNGKTQGILDDINAATVQVLNLVVTNRSKIDLQSLQA